VTTETRGSKFTHADVRNRLRYRGFTSQYAELLCSVNPWFSQTHPLRF